MKTARYQPSRMRRISPIYPFLFLFLLSAALSGCNALFAGAVLGLRNTPPNTPAQVATDAERYELPAAQVFVLDTSYLTFLRRQPARLHDATKNHSQPLQLLYFNQTGQLTSFHINCYAEPKLPIPNLNWNPGGRLGTFPPATQIPPDSLLSFPALRAFLRTPAGQPVPAARFANGHRKVVAFWSRTMGRQTRILLRELKQNLTHVPPAEPVDVLYVNNDAFVGIVLQ